MGEKLVKYYKFVEKKIGLEGRMRLAMKTYISGSVAPFRPDSPELLAMFRAVVKEITGEDVDPSQLDSLN